MQSRVHSLCICQPMLSTVGFQVPTRNADAYGRENEIYIMEDLLEKYYVECGIQLFYFLFLGRIDQSASFAHMHVYLISCHKHITALIYHSQRSRGGREGRMTRQRRESNPQPADSRMIDRLPRPTQPSSSMPSNSFCDHTQFL